MEEMALMYNTYEPFIILMMDKPKGELNPINEKDYRTYFHEYTSAAVTLRGQISFFYLDEYQNFAKEIRKNVLGFDEKEIPAIFAVQPYQFRHEAHKFIFEGNVSELKPDALVSFVNDFL